MACYNLYKGPDDDPTNINILEAEGKREAEGSGMSSDQFLKPLKIKKVNIGSSNNPKFTNIGDYWAEETVAKIMYLLHEYHDLFLTSFSEMKGIVGYLGDMKLPVRPDAKLSKNRLYRMNPEYKERVGHMLDAIIIETIDESEWFIPIMI